MAAAGRGGTAPDHYQLLGVARGASREEIAQAWRTRARAERPDSRPGQAGGEADGRFRVEGPPRAPSGPGEREIRAAVLAELALRYLAAGRDGPW